jgi:hypothetical protein
LVHIDQCIQCYQSGPRERRRTSRKTFTQPAGLFHPDGKRTCGCVTRDISATGARLKVDRSQSAIDEIPSEFILTISESGKRVSPLPACMAAK